MARLNGLGDELKERYRPPITLPKLNLPDIDTELEAREAAERAAELRTIREGLACWREIGRAQSFAAWVKIGRALAVGRELVIRQTGANAPMGRRYSWAFSAWCKAHGFGTMPAATRSNALTLYEHAAEIEAWLATAPLRRRLTDAQSILRRWRAATQYGGKSPADLKTEAVAAWRRFVSCAQALPQDQAAALWSMVKNETPSCETSSPIAA